MLLRGAAESDGLRALIGRMVELQLVVQAKEAGWPWGSWPRA
jgi:hypothetical protein